MILELVIFLFTVFGFVWIYWTWNYDYWKKRGVPFVKPRFPFGNIDDIILMRRTMGEVYDEIYWNFPDKPFCGFFKLTQPVLMVRDPELVKSVLVKEFQNFHDNDYYVNPDLDPILGLNPFNCRGERWKAARAVVTPSLTSSKIKDMAPLMADVAEEMINYLHENENTYLEAYDMVGKYTTDVVSSCAYGLLSNSFKSSESELRKMSKKLFDGSLSTNVALLCAFYAPRLGNMLRLKMITKEVSDFFVHLVTKITETRLKTGETRSDYIQTLIDQHKNDEDFNYVEMAAHCMTFFLDGYETAALLLAFTLYEIGLNPDIQDKLRCEIQTSGKKLRDFSASDIISIDYLSNVVSETLRKHPPGTTTTRVCTQDTVLQVKGHEVHVKKGTPVVLPMYSLHNDPLHFPHPDLFDPERFTPDNTSKRHAYSYFPFGAGPRSCPGNPFGLLMVKMAIIGILLEFEISPQYRALGKVELDPMNTFFHSAKNGLWLKYRRL